MAAKAGKESIDFTQISEWIEFNEAVMPDMKKHNAYNNSRCFTESEQKPA